MASRICDFCLDEPKGLFNRPERLPGDHYICKKCKKIIESYDLPVKYDLFQLLVTAQPEMREMLMGSYLETNTPEDCTARFYPLPKVLLHRGEHCVNECASSITVDESRIPQSTAVRNIADITRKDIVNLPDQEHGTSVKGRLYETDAALYFVSEHFINCHRLANIVHQNNDNDVIRVLEQGRSYTYRVPHADLFFLRETFYRKVTDKSSKKKNLIYVASENTITLTPGVYKVPKNIQAGTYWVSAVKDNGLHIRDAAGTVRGWRSGRVHLDEGSQLEVTGEYQFRIKQHEEPGEPEEAAVPETTENNADISDMVNDSTQVLVLQDIRRADRESRMKLRLPDDLTQTAALPLIDEEFLKKYGK